MKLKFFTTSAFLLLVVVCFAIADSLTGKWNGTVKLDGSEYPISFTFKAESGKLIGTSISPQGEEPITKGKINGDNFTFNVSVNGMDIPNTGKFYPAADSIGMDIDYGGTKLHTTLKRTR